MFISALQVSVWLLIKTLVAKAQNIQNLPLQVPVPPPPVLSLRQRDTMQSITKAMQGEVSMEVDKAVAKCWINVPTKRGSFS